MAKKKKVVATRPVKLKKEEIISEFECIVEFSYNPKQERFVVRFLNGTSYVVDTSELPQKMQSKKPDWEHAQLSSKRNALIVLANGGKDIREIPSHIIHSKGKEV